MAHKHSRRRQRPRSRNHDYSLNTFGLSQYLVQPRLTFDTSVNLATNVSKLGLCTAMPALKYQDRILQTNVNTRTAPLSSSQAGARFRRYDRTSRKTVDYATPPWTEKFELEEQQIKLFGGEPGDDIGLCFKMLEAFGRMEWIDG